MSRFRDLAKTLLQTTHPPRRKQGGRSECCASRGEDRERVGWSVGRQPLCPGREKRRATLLSKLSAYRRILLVNNILIPFLFVCFCTIIRLFIFLRLSFGRKQEATEYSRSVSQYTINTGGASNINLRTC